MLATATASALVACSPSLARSDRTPDPEQEASVAPTRVAYGPEPQQFGELHRPDGRSRGTVVVVHGGFWQDRYDLRYGRPLAADLAARGWTAWNIEYRRVGGGGGWPTTFTDVAAAVDHLARLDVDTSAVVAVGHSAGGHLAVWAAGRGGLPEGAPGSDPVVELAAVVSQAGVLDLTAAADQGVGGTAALDLMGGTPEQHPDRYRLADPALAVPLGVPVVCVHSPADALVPIDQSRRYVDASTAAGGHARLVEVEGDHFAVIDPASPAWDGGRFVEVALSDRPD
ncbi:Alpha/beta hydrolase family protein [Auraticoccus monumenti]|uniref:Alpha/beta hydrolase family protein n=1 Tax=Auraticoccus monumenti TaxID=675864 RepID=A0A1G7DAQ3_9ACTN|nr:Alpha/beta hydrolase family protein [Auraticoccus monumenti]